jgi:alanine racemase
MIGTALGTAVAGALIGPVLGALAVEVGTEVVLLGRQGKEEIPALELATHAGTISWEILCHLGLRLPRRYVRGGRIEELVTRFSREDS